MPGGSSSSAAATATLAEKDVLVSSQQYDVELVYHVSLQRKGYETIAPATFARCHALQLVDVSGNRLSTLAGLAPVAPQLTYLNVAENRLQDIGAVAACTALQYCHLEGNQLASVAALAPLRCLSSLVELVLQRSVVLQDAGAHETFLLDNPVCRDAAVYQSEFVQQLSHVRWVDGVSSFQRSKAPALLELSGDAQEELSTAVASLESVRAAMTAGTAEEKELATILMKASTCCKEACAA